MVQTMLHENPNSIAASIVSFCRFGRSRGLQVGMEQTVAALEAANLVGVVDRQNFSFALRAALCASHEEWLKFDGLFDEFWDQERSDAADTRSRQKLARANRSQQSNLVVQLESELVSSADTEGKLVGGASAEQRLKKMDFAEASQTEMAALENIAIRLLREMSVRISRRLRIQAQRDRIDLRRSIRQNITRGGDPMVLAYKGRKPQKIRLVIFLDISGSMNLYSLFLLRFAYALQKHFKHVNTFLFSTDVVEISSLLRTRKLSDALTAVSQGVPEWSGGTRIGGSLREFNRRFGRRVLSSNVFFIILSDGWDTGAPEVLAAELRQTRSHVQKLLWLNPLLGLKDYQPITRGMSTALPHIDVFAPAHNLESLLSLEKFL
jgi:uncharacterized protein with von Willebrand factor type A (vWA) domain